MRGAAIVQEPFHFGANALQRHSIALTPWYTLFDSRWGGGAISGKVVGIIAGGAVVLILAIIVLSFFIGQTLVDIFIILAALASLTAFACLTYAALQVVALVQEVRGEIRLLVGNAQDAVTEVRGTARFVSETVVQPVSQVAGFVSATRATIKAFTEPLYKRRS